MVRIPGRRRPMRAASGEYRTILNARTICSGVMEIYSRDALGAGMSGSRAGRHLHRGEPRRPPPFQAYLVANYHWTGFPGHCGPVFRAGILFSGDIVAHALLLTENYAAPVQEVAGRRVAQV